METKVARRRKGQSGGQPVAVSHFQETLTQGKHWYLALLEAMGQWEMDQEEVDGRTYRYLIEGEAFDWPLLAERLCSCADGAIPESEMSALLHEGRPPLDLPWAGLRKLLGAVRYRAYLNYFYGVEVEAALQQAVEAEIVKENMPFHRCVSLTAHEECFQRIYGVSQERLLRHFQEERGHLHEGHSSPEELKAFTYWLFKYRLAHCDPARVASDTRKGLTRLWRRRRIRPTG